MGVKKKCGIICRELNEHVPFTLVATLLAVVITSVVFLIYSSSIISTVTSLFYIFHPAHVFVSAVVSAGIFYKYRKSFLLAVVIGIASAVIIGSLSDIVLPYLGGTLFGLKTSFHLEVFEKPLLILGVALVGGVVGTVTQLTKLPHFLHVLLSVFASLFYLFAFSLNINFLAVVLIGVIVFIAVLIPCCLSDIIIPLLFVRKKKYL